MGPPYDAPVPEFPAFVSYAQNREDVVLWRALRHVEGGRYVDVGANEPRDQSVTRALYDHGWSGITVEPVPELAQAHRVERPRDTVVEAAATDGTADQVTLHVFEGTGLSTLVDEHDRRHREDGFEGTDLEVPARTLDDVMAAASWDGLDVHVVVIDVEGAEAAVLRGLDLARWCPWVLVVEATEPRSTTPSWDAWEAGVLAAGYRLTLFDGVSRFYVSTDHLDLEPALSYPACALDEFETDHDRALRERVALLEDEVVRWRAAALSRWADLAVELPAHADQQRRAAALQAEIDAMHRTVSWRVTAPLRAAQVLRREG